MVVIAVSEGPRRVAGVCDPPSSDEEHRAGFVVQEAADEAEEDLCSIAAGGMSDRFALIARAAAGT